MLKEEYCAICGTLLDKHKEVLFYKSFEERLVCEDCLDEWEKSCFEEIDLDADTD